MVRQSRRRLRSLQLVSMQFQDLVEGSRSLKTTLGSIQASGIQEATASATGNCIEVDTELSIAINKLQSFLIKKSQPK